MRPSAHHSIVNYVFILLLLAVLCADSSCSRKGPSQESLRERKEKLDAQFKQFGDEFARFIVDGKMNEAYAMTSSRLKSQMDINQFTREAMPALVKGERITGFTVEAFAYNYVEAAARDFKARCREVPEEDRAAVFRIILDIDTDEDDQPDAAMSGSALVVREGGGNRVCSFIWQQEEE